MYSRVRTVSRSPAVPSSSTSWTSLRMAVASGQSKASRYVSVSVSWRGSPPAGSGQMHVTVTSTSAARQAQLGLGQRVDHDRAEHPAEVVGVVEEPAHKHDDGVAALVVLGPRVVAQRSLEGEGVEHAGLG